MKFIHPSPKNTIFVWMGINTPRILPNYTYDDYIHWEGRWEIIDGIPYAMSPMPRPEHQAVAVNLSAELRISLRNIGCKICKVYQPIDYKVKNNTILNPDILIVCGEIDQQYLDFPPVLVVEILSPSTDLKDRHTKFDIYQSQGIKYYLIVDIETKTIEIYTLKRLKYHRTDDLTFHLDEECVIHPDLTAIWT